MSVPYMRCGRIVDALARKEGCHGVEKEEKRKTPSRSATGKAWVLRGPCLGAPTPQPLPVAERVPPVADKEDVGNHGTKKKALRTEGCFVRHDSIHLRSHLGASNAFRGAEVLASPTKAIE
jgi:hypothetical protein